ncbi:MAG: PEP-CTERM sorting domain-containing protein, partial [Planctomycetales bacterium]|nr:PEP-CTERM sorting domain-containing protein [Planctomycetales bacterium]
GQEAINNILRSLVTNCDENGCSVMLTGRYLIDPSAFGREVIRSADVEIRYSLGFGGDFDLDGIIGVADIKALTEQTAAGTNDPIYDLTGDGAVDFDDIQNWVDEKAVTYFGDANLDREYNSSDLVKVFQAAKYEKGIPANWCEGDFNGDGFFDSGDLILSFIQNTYEQGPRTSAHAVPEPASIVLLLVGLTSASLLKRRR